MLEGRYKNSEGSLGDGGGTTEGRRNRKTRKKKKNWTSRKKEANCVKTFLFLFCFFFFFCFFFHLVLSISYRGWTYEVSQRANLPIFYLSSFLGSCGGNRGDIEGKGEHWLKGRERGRGNETEMKKANRGREKEGECLQRFPSNFSNLIKSYPVWKLSFVSRSKYSLINHPLIPLYKLLKFLKKICRKDRRIEIEEHRASSRSTRWKIDRDWFLNRRNYYQFVTIE